VACRKDLRECSPAVQWRCALGLQGHRAVRAIVLGASIISAVCVAHGQTGAASPSKSAPAHGALGSAKLALYAGAGPELTQYDVDLRSATLTKRATLTLPANIREGWIHPSEEYVYIAWSRGEAGNHGLSAFRIDPASGALYPHGPSPALPNRPVYLTADIPGTHVLVASNHPSGIVVHGIEADGAIGPEVKNSPGLDFGVYAHQVRVDPSNNSVILVTRGNPSGDGKPEDPGALKVYKYKDGVLTNWASIAPGGGINFRARHMDFDPLGRWIFVTLERQNKLHVYQRMKDGTIGSAPLFSKGTLADPGNIRPGQAAGTVHAHPSGKFVYVANRILASAAAESDGKRFIAGGENTIAVYSLNQGTGEPTLIQNIDTRGMNPRTFAIDPSGRLLVAANQLPYSVRDGNTVKTIPASLAVYRIGGDGKLDFIRKYAIALGGALNIDEGLTWVEFVKLR
jgi:6-phosphogluconolactonase